MTRAVDASSFLGQWPFRPSWLARPEALTARLRVNDVAACLVAPTAGLLVDDPSAANEWLFRQAERWDVLRPVALWNPSMPNAAAALAGIVEAKAVAVKLAPSYHRYELGDPSLGHALDALERTGLVACIQLRVEDQRQARFQCPDVPVDAALAVAASRPNVRWVLCGARTPEVLRAGVHAAGSGNLWLELSNTDGLACLGTIASAIRPGRLLFGAHAPFFYPEANALKVLESDLSNAARDAILWRNAEALFGLGLAAQRGPSDDG